MMAEADPAAGQAGVMDALAEGGATACEHTFDYTRMWWSWQASPPRSRRLRPRARVALLAVQAAAEEQLETLCASALDEDIDVLLKVADAAQADAGPAPAQA